jgi:hypothetical protein
MTGMIDSYGVKEKRIYKNGNGNTSRTNKKTGTSRRSVATQYCSVRNIRRLGEGPTTLHHKKKNRLLRNVKQGLGQALVDMVMNLRVL